MILMDISKITTCLSFFYNTNLENYCLTSSDDVLEINLHIKYIL